MNRLKIIATLVIFLIVTTAEACRYTIREIGFSTLSKVTYVMYRVDADTGFFPKQQGKRFGDSNVKPIGIHLNENKDIAKFIRTNKVALPAYILVDPNNRMLALPISNTADSTVENVLFSPYQNKLLSVLPKSYASVIVIEGKNALENKEVKNTVLEACQRITNIIPNMPKQVANGPGMLVVSKDNFIEEKTLCWSLGVDKIPEHAMAFIVYGRGRIMGEKITAQQVAKDDVYKLLSIIGADCECGLDRKWMLGYQVPLNWPSETRQHLSNDLGFDVDNPMVLAEMSRILAIENNIPKNPDRVSFEPIVIDLDKEFKSIPSIDHSQKKEEIKEGLSSNRIILYSIVAFLLIISIGLYIILKKKN